MKMTIIILFEMMFFVALANAHHVMLVPTIEKTVADNYPKIHIRSNVTQMGANGKLETLMAHAVVNQKAFRIRLIRQLTGKYHADLKEMVTESKWQTITIVDNRMMDMNFDSSRQFLMWINRHGYKAQYSERSGSTMNFTFKQIT